MKNILLIGNPNTGKTTLFNSLTSSDEKVGNWNGVTNNYIIKKMNYKNNEMNVVDLPGTYSLTPFTYEEKVTVDFLYKDNKKSLTLCLCEIDALSKNLFLALELIEFGQDIILVINNKNKEKNCEIDIEKLSKKLGVKVFLIDFENKIQVEKLKDELITHQKNIYKEFDYLQPFINKFSHLKENYRNFEDDYVLIRLLEQDEYFLKMTKKQIPDKMEEICLARHNYIKSLNCIKIKKKDTPWQKLDRILLSKYFALPIFFALMLLIFYLTFFSLGALLSSVLENFIVLPIKYFTINLISSLTTTPFIISFFEQGVFSAFSIIVKFFPQVILLFFFLNLIEQSGYLSRIAFIFEDILNKFGLSGKSIYTILMGFGCTVPAVMTSRTVVSKKAQIKTAILTPFMSCSAKIPIYAVLGGAFFGVNNIFMIFFLYILGLMTGFIVMYFLEKSILKSGSDSFVLEFTNLQIIKIKKIFKDVLKSVKEFFSRIFLLVICSNIIIWIMSSFSFNLKYVGESIGQSDAFTSKSILQVISEILLPIFKPLGFTSWVHISALVTGLIAKEIVLSTLALFASFNSNLSLTEQFSDVTSLVYFSSAGAFSYLIFVLLYPPCFASLGMLKKEIGNKWTTFSIVLQLLLAYILSFIGHYCFLLFVSHTIEFILFGVILVLFAFSLRFLIFKKKCATCNFSCKSCK